MRRVAILAISLTLFTALASSSAILDQHAAPGETTIPDKEAAFIGTRGRYWTFQQVVQPAVPKIENAWVKTPLDAFILQHLMEKHLTPSPALGRIALLRRVTYDLTGLPPTPEEVDAFVRDPDSDAYEKVVDRLLASPHYGERWASKWLDVVRYADSNGFELDQDRPHAWRYRDYVIQSFNQDKSYKRFIEEQIAGDEMFPGDKTALVASGYLRAGSEHVVSGNIDPAESRQEVLTEIATNVGQTYLAMTVNCARCHNHKFDPILQADFYRLQAVFAAGKGKEVEIANAEEKAAFEAADAAYKLRLNPVQEELKALAKPFADKLREERKARLDPKLLAALEVPKEQRTAEQKTLAHDAESQISAAWDEIVAIMPPEVLTKRAALREKLHQVEFTAPDPLPTAYAYVNTGEGAPQSFTLRLGDPHSPLDPVEASVPRVIKANYEIPQEPMGRRTAFVKWLAAEENPLTARVMINRIWQYRMGTGLVRTLNDFGTMGDKPERHDMLDWLASEFMRKGWSVKAIDRLIVTSNVYQQSSTSDETKAKVDPEDRLYWRMNRKRFDAEMIRDAALSISGTLNPQVGGRPVRNAIEPEVYNLIFTEFERDGLWPVSPDKTVRNRRALYLYNKRSVRLPLLSAFDQPDNISSCPIRPTSTHALQALSLLNSDFMQDVSKDFARRLETACGTNRTCMIQSAWTLALSRKPRKEELKLAKSFLSSGGTLIDFCLALFNRNEFVYVP